MTWTTAALIVLSIMVGGLISRLEQLIEHQEKMGELLIKIYKQGGVK